MHGYIYDESMEQEKNILKLHPYFLICKQRTSKSRNSNFKKKPIHLIAGNCNLTLNFPALDFPHSISRKAGISK